MYKMITMLPFYRWEIWGSVRLVVHRVDKWKSQDMNPDSLVLGSVLLATKLIATKLKALPPVGNLMISQSWLRSCRVLWDSGLFITMLVSQWRVLGLAFWWLGIWRDYPACSVTSSSGCRVLTMVRTMAGDLLMDRTWEPVIERRVSMLTPGFLAWAIWHMLFAMSWIFTSPCLPTLHGYVGFPMPSVMVFGDGTFGRSLVHEGGVELADEISALTRRDMRAFFTPLFPPMWGHSKKAAICKPGRVLPSPDQEELSGAESASTSILDFLDSKTVRNKFLLFKPPRVWCLVIASCTKGVVFSQRGQEEWGGFYFYFWLSWSWVQFWMHWVWFPLRLVRGDFRWSLGTWKVLFVNNHFVDHYTLDGRWSWEMDVHVYMCVCIYFSGAVNTRLLKINDKSSWRWNIQCARLIPWLCPGWRQKIHSGSQNALNYYNEMILY